MTTTQPHSWQRTVESVLLGIESDYGSLTPGLRKAVEVAAREAREKGADIETACRSVARLIVFAQREDARAPDHKAPRGAITRTVENRPTERERVFSRHLARLAAASQHVRMFRQSVLGSATATLTKGGARRLLASLDPAWVSGHARWLVDEYGWTEPEAIDFLICGNVPILPPIRVEMARYHAMERVPTQAWVTVRAMPHVQPEAVAAAYRAAQQRVTGHRSGRPIEPDNLAVLDFVADQVAMHGPLDWPRLMRLWNRKPGVRPYKHPSKMRRDYETTARRVFLLDLRPGEGPGPCGLDVVEKVLAARPEAPSFFTDGQPPFVGQGVQNGTRKRKATRSATAPARRGRRSPPAADRKPAR